MRNVLCVALFLCVALLPGCWNRTAFTYPYIPAIPVPAKPDLPAVSSSDLAPLTESVRTKLLMRDAMLKQQLEVYGKLVDDHNAWASRLNVKSGFSEE